MGDAELWRRHYGAGGVREDVRERERKQDDISADDRDRRLHESAQVATDKAVVSASRRPEGRRAETDEQQTSREREEAGVVVPRGADLQAVIAGLAHSGDDPEQSQRDRDRRTEPGAKARIRGREGNERGERHETADEVIGGRGAGFGLDEVVVDQMHRDRSDRRTGKRAFAAGGCDSQAEPAEGAGGAIGFLERVCGRVHHFGSPFGGGSGRIERMRPLRFAAYRGRGYAPAQ